MYHPTKTLPKHPIPPPQPQHLNLPRQPNDSNPERQLNPALTVWHINNTVFHAPLILATISATPDILARFADAAGLFFVPDPFQVQRGDVRVDRVFGGGG
jgi:hypothetical protein